ncbi:MAG TPA: ATP-binding cassette domain-containing protein [Sediminispirochaeta sp.]|nr:ATP-binding cassette domain-containing protein [Sediminispirochaeta sp.]
MEMRLQEVDFYYGSRVVLDHVDLSIDPGRTTVIVGASGSGKSILLKVLAGLLPPHRGRVLWDGKNIFDLSQDEEVRYRKRSSFVFQDAALWSNRTIRQNVEFPLQVHFPELSVQQREEKVRYYLDKVAYQDSIEYRPEQISAGERKMVSLARALVTRPKTLFMDSPLTDIDATSVEGIKSIIKKLHSERRTIIACFVDPEFISLMADDLIVLHRGRVLAHGPFHQVKKSSDPLVRGVLAMVLNEVTAYDDDILDLLNSEEQLL